MIGESIGNYRIVAKLGQGGMGTVYQAEDTQLGRKVAIKILNPGLMAQGGRELERFRAEAKVQASLNNPNVVTLYDFVPYGDSFYMVMEFVDGMSLADLVRTVGALPPHIVVSLSKQILEGLSAAHRLGVVHRDLKPSNILLTPEGVAKVMDFGIAKVQGSKSLTATGALVGTVYYMSPEQVRGESVDARSDIYSFGVILFELLTGRVPFKDDSDFKIMVQHVQTPPPLPTQLLPEIPTALEDVVLLCLQKKSEERFQSADAILSALDSFEEQERALGRGQIYTRRTLAQWVASTTSGATPGRTPPPAALFPPPFPAGEPPVVSGFQALAASSGGPPPVDRPERAYTVTPPIPPELRESLARQGAPAAPQKGLLFALALFLIVLLAGGGGYYLLRNRIPPSPNATSQPSIVQATAETTLPATTQQPVSPSEPAAGKIEPPASSGAVAPAAVPPSGAESKLPMQEASRNLLSTSRPATAGSASPKGPEAAPPMQEAARGRAPSTPAVEVSPAVTAEPGRPRETSAPAGRTTATKPTVAGAAPGARAGRQEEAAKLPRGFLIFFDLDQSSERLPLATAQSQVGDIVRQAGYQVVSGGVVAAGVRSALDRGDLASIRSHGIGYVILGTATGSLESQVAYGSTYNVGKVNVNLELIRMSDGSVAARGSSDARSRGSANAASALSEALLTATSDSARELMRQFHP